MSKRNQRNFARVAPADPTKEVRYLMSHRDEPPPSLPQVKRSSPRVGRLAPRGPDVFGVSMPKGYKDRITLPPIWGSKATERNDDGQ